MTFTPQTARLAMTFDPDALLAALPRRIVATTFVPAGRAVSPEGTALGQLKEYNGFTLAERQRLGSLSRKLTAKGLAFVSSSCGICRGPASDEHAENYYDLSTYVALCRSCHRNRLHKRFANPRLWLDLLDANEVQSGHWARLLTPEPFDLARLLRARGVTEPKSA